MQRFDKLMSLIVALLLVPMINGCNGDDGDDDWIKADFSKSNVIYISKKESKTTTSHIVSAGTCFVNAKEESGCPYHFDCQIDNSSDVYALQIDCRKIGDAELLGDLSVGEKLDISQFQATLFFHTLATEYRSSYPQATNGSIIVEENSILDNKRVITLRLDNLFFREYGGRYEGTYILNGTVIYQIVFVWNGIVDYIDNNNYYDNLRTSVR